MAHGVRANHRTNKTMNMIVLGAVALAAVSVAASGMVLVMEREPAPAPAVEVVPAVSPPPAVQTHPVTRNLHRVEKRLEELGVECATEDCFPDS